MLVHYGRGLPSPATGGNVGVSIIHPPGYAAPANFHWTQHELVHYWFVGNEGWIDEGLAQALTGLMEADEDGGHTLSSQSSVQRRWEDCGYHRRHPSGFGG